MPSGDSSGAPVYYHCSTSLLLKFTKVCCTSFDSRFGADDGSFARRTSELDPAGKARKCDRRRQHFCQPAAIWPTEDFQDYPRNQEQDRLLCEQAGVDVIFAPSATEMFGSQAVDSLRDSFASRTETEKTAQKQIEIDLSFLTQVVPPPAMTSVLCGKSSLVIFRESR